MTIGKKILVFVAAAGLVFGIMACGQQEGEGPAQKAGKKVDELLGKAGEKGKEIKEKVLTKTKEAVTDTKKTVHEMVDHGKDQAAKGGEAVHEMEGKTQKAAEGAKHEMAANATSAPKAEGKTLHEMGKEAVDKAKEGAANKIHEMGDKAHNKGKKHIEGC